MCDEVDGPSAATAERHAANVAALRRLRILDSAPETAFDHIVAIAAQTFGAPTVLISLIDFDRQWFKARVGMAAPETGLDVSFCKHAVRGQDVFVVLDATADDRFDGNRLVTGPEGIRFYAGAPLVTSDGYPVGSLCLIDTAPRHAFDAADRRLLRMMGDLVVELMEGRASKRAADAAAERLADFTSTALDIFWETDAQHRFTHVAIPYGSAASDAPDDMVEVERAIAAMIGRTRWEVLAVDLSVEPWRSHHDLVEARQPFRDLRYSRPVGDRILHFSVSGKPFYNQAGRYMGYRGATHDVTAQEEARLAALHLAHTDVLTGLPNRRSWGEMVGQRLSLGGDAPASVVILDVDRFKDVNDELGHAAGDALLVEVAARIRRARTTASSSPGWAGTNSFCSSTGASRRRRARRRALPARCGRRSNTTGTRSRSRSPSASRRPAPARPAPTT